MPYCIGSFNICKIGEQTVEQRKRDWGLISAFIRRERIDILAVQEVFSKVPVDHLRDTLNCSFFGSWDSRFDLPRTALNGIQEGYAFLWNRRRVGLLPKENGLFYEPHIETRYGRSLVRPPYIGRFVPVGWSTPFIEIRVINTHIIYGTASEVPLRIKEYQKIAQAVYPKISNDRLAGAFRPAYTFVAGDYNLRHSQCAGVDLQHKLRTRQRQPTTVRRKQADTDRGGYTENDYDHFSHSDHEGSYVHLAERIRVPEKYCGSDFQRYRETVSDHVPVRLDLDVGQSVSAYTMP